MGKKYSEMTVEQKAAAVVNYRRWRAKNLESAREYARKSRAANREKRNASMRKYYVENREKCRANRREWCAENREKHRASNRAWAAKNPEKVRLIAARTHQKKKLGPLGMAMKVSQGIAKAETA